MFADNLKTARKKRGQTQASLAESLGVSKGAVAMWETGKRQPSLEKLGEISDLLHVSTDYLIKGTMPSHMTVSYYEVNIEQS